MAQYKISLDTKKIVVLRDFTIKLKNQAVEAAGIRAGQSGSQKGFEAALQDECLKILIVSVDGRSVSATEREDLDSLFTYAEYQQLLMSLGEIMGGADIKKPKIEVIISGS